MPDSMRKLSEIISICKSGEKPTIDEARLAVCVLGALLTFETTRLMRRCKDGEKERRDFEAHFGRCSQAFSQPPRDYLGDEYNPDNPEVQRRLAMLAKLFDKATS